MQMTLVLVLIRVVSRILEERREFLRSFFQEGMSAWG